MCPANAAKTTIPTERIFYIESIYNRTKVTQG